MANPFPSLLLALAPTLFAAGEPQQAAPRRVVGRFTVQQRIVIRVPRMGPAMRMSASPMVWKEHKGPKCLRLGEVAAATIAAPASIDLLLADGRRIRARLDGDCRSADFYNGLYIRPGRDGRLCADRDAIRVRSGAKCEIDVFKLLAQTR